MLDDILNFKNGGEGLPQMTPAERKIWMASHGAPPDMLMVSRDEMMVMHNANREIQRENHMYLKAHARLEEIVPEEYWTSEPDMVNAVGALAFDAERDSKIAALVLLKLRPVGKRLEAAIKLAGTALAPVVLADFVEAVSAIDSLLESITKAKAKRRDRATNKAVK